MKKPSPFIVKYLPIVLLVFGVVLILRAFIMSPTVIDIVTKGFTPKGTDHLIGMIIGIALVVYHAFNIRKKYQSKD
jgi:hypothetical protein